MVNRRTWRRLGFQVEADLEDYLQVHLQLHLSNLGLDLLIIGRQAKTATRGMIDLLAIDATGVVHIIELKLGRANPAITAQLLAYRRPVKRMVREDLIHLAACNRLRVDLPSAFQRRFGHPLPETVNRSQVLVAIAASMHPQTAQSLLELKESGYSVEAFRYVVSSHVLQLVPFRLEEQDLKLPVATKRSMRQPRPTSSPQNQLTPYNARIDVKWFWMIHALQFISNLVTFTFVHDLYVRWVWSHAVDGIRPIQAGVFARQLAVLVASSGGWTRVLLPPGTTIDPYEPLAEPPSMSARIDASHRLVAYLRRPEMPS